MDYNVFKDLIADQLKEDIPGPKKIFVQELRKNNGVSHDGIVIREGDINISPAIHLDYYYDLYQSGVSFQETYSALLESYLKNKASENIDMEFFREYEKVEDMLCVKLIDHARNKDLLENIPHKRFLDLAIVFFLYLPMPQNGTSATILVRNEHIKDWGVSLERLYKSSINNTQNILPARFQSIDAVLGGLSSPLLGEERPPSKDRMIILSNESNLFGASCILYKGLLKSFAKGLGFDLYILPSSIHEVILVPSPDRERLDDLSAIVREVNDSQLKAEEILSDHAYYYSADDDIISM